MKAVVSGATMQCMLRVFFSFGIFLQCYIILLVLCSFFATVIFHMSSLMSFYLISCSSSNPSYSAEAHLMNGAYPSALKYRPQWILVYHNNWRVILIVMEIKFQPLLGFLTLEGTVVTWNRANSNRTRITNKGRKLVENT